MNIKFIDILCNLWYNIYLKKCIFKRKQFNINLLLGGIDMEIQISKNITELYNRIVDSNLEFETRNYASLNADEKNAILLETYERIFKALWNAPSRKTKFKKESEARRESNNFNVLKNTFQVGSRNQIIMFAANLSFSYNSRVKMFTVTIDSAYAKKRNNVKQYSEWLCEELEEIKETFENQYTDRIFIYSFFMTLHAHKLTILSGREAILMYTIYNKAVTHYPLFKNLPYKKQISLMYNAVMQGLSQSKGSRDIHLYSKVTFEILTKENLISVLTGVDEFENVYHMVCENRRTRKNPENHSEVWEYDCLIFVTYEIQFKNQRSYRTSFSAETLWNILN